MEHRHGFESCLYYKDTYFNNEEENSDMPDSQCSGW